MYTVETLSLTTDSYHSGILLGLCQLYQHAVVSRQCKYLMYWFTCWWTYGWNTWKKKIFENTRNLFCVTKKYWYTKQTGCKITIFRKLVICCPHIMCQKLWNTSMTNMPLFFKQIPGCLIHTLVILYPFSWASEYYSTGICTFAVCKIASTCSHLLNHSNYETIITCGSYYFHRSFPLEVSTLLFHQHYWSTPA